MSLNIYAGPAKVTIAVGVAPTKYSFYPDGDAGAVKVDLIEGKVERGSAALGFQTHIVTAQSAKVSLTPYDSWSILPVLFPFSCVHTGAGATAGPLKIGGRAHDTAAGAANGLAPTSVFGLTNSNLYVLNRSAITKHPNMMLGVGKPLFDGLEITGLSDLTVISPKDIITITESSASDPDATFTNDYINEKWTGIWGTIAGFGGGGSDVPMQAEDFWTLKTNATYNTRSIAGWPWHMDLKTVEFQLSAKIVGFTHTQLFDRIKAHVQGQALGASATGSGIDLTLTGATTAKTIALKNCEVSVDNSAISYGGSGLAAPQVTFYSRVTTLAGAVAPSLIISA